MFLLSILVLVIGILYAFLKYQYSYWQRRGIAYDESASIPYGSLKSVSKHEKSMGMAIYDVYKQTKGRFAGFYMLYRPALLIRDAELAHTVLAEEFASFHDRGLYVDEQNNPFSASLFALEGDRWRQLRSQLEPSFTPAKLRSMFGSAEDIGNKMVAYLNGVLPAKGSGEVDLKYITTTYASDIIASVIFGLDINSFENPENEFRLVVTRARRNTFFSAIFGMLLFMCPAFAKCLFALGFKNKIAETLMGILKQTIEYRETNGVVRKDMLQVLMQLRQTGQVAEQEVDSHAKKSTASDKAVMQPLSIELITAQAFIFYLAGQESTSSSIAFTIFELAQQPELLNRAQDEVQQVLNKHEGKVSYEALKEMHFLEMCIKESFRKYPLPMLNRECTRDFIIPGTDTKILKGTPIAISLFGIHRNAEYFPEPERFNPDRFSEEQQNFNPIAYLPFGAGPRHCIAQRMGHMNTKLGLVKILQNFNVDIMEAREIEIDNHSVGLVPKGGVPIKLSKK